MEGVSISMMKFEETESLIFEDKVTLISTEIIREYPGISVDEAIRIASLCDTVEENVTADVMFNRYYYILAIMGKSNPLYDRVICDMKNNCSGELKDSLNQRLYEDILKYNNGELSEFPSISD